MVGEFLEKYLQDLSQIFHNIDATGFSRFLGRLQEAYRLDKQIFVCGNGGSGATASHLACDLNKGVNCCEEKRFKVICLNDNISTMLAYANDVSYDDVFVEQLKNYFSPGDLVIGISASGNSVNVLKTLEYANNNAGRSFGISGFGGGKLRDIANEAIVVDSYDMQKVEDLHLIFVHCAMQFLNYSMGKTQPYADSEKLKNIIKA